jgi:hypothetical protein
MAGEGGFLARWSKRKRGDLAEPETVSSVSPAPVPVPPASVQDDPPVQLNLPEVPVVDAPEFDLASLPTLDELTGTSDMSAFLQKGVPQALQNAALRKAWVLDPFIRDHVGPVECGWDFNDPMSMTGFGPLDTNVDAGVMLKQIMGEPELAEPGADGRLPETIAGDGAAMPEPAVAVEEGATGDPVGDADSPDVDSPALDASGREAVPDGQEAAQLPAQNHAASHNDTLDKIEEIPIFPVKRRHGGAVPG